MSVKAFLGKNNYRVVFRRSMSTLRLYLEHMTQDALGDPCWMQHHGFDLTLSHPQNDKVEIAMRILVEEIERSHTEIDALKQRIESHGKVLNDVTLWLQDESKYEGYHSTTRDEMIAYLMTSFDALNRSSSGEVQ